MSEYEEAIDVILESVRVLIQHSEEKSTKIYAGVVISVNLDGTYSVKFNDKIHSLRKYGSNVIELYSAVKVFIPQGNMNLAFIM